MCGFTGIVNASFQPRSEECQRKFIHGISIISIMWNSMANDFHLSLPPQIIRFNKIEGGYAKHLSHE